MAKPATVKLELDSCEALVLFEFLTREVDGAKGARIRSLIDHEGELWALNGLQICLERVLVEPLRKDYSVELSSANDALVARWGAWPYPD